MTDAHNRSLLGTARSQCDASCGRVRNLHSNQLSGTIPNGFGTANSLTTLYVLRWTGKHEIVVCVIEVVLCNPQFVLSCFGVRMIELRDDKSGAINQPL